MTPKLFVIGAGPIGIEAAVHAVKQGFEVTVIEKAETIAGNVHEWGHVELFSPWSLNMSDLGREILCEMGKELPHNDIFPTGSSELQYLRFALQSLQTLSEVDEGKGWGKVQRPCNFSHTFPTLLIIVPLCRQTACRAVPETTH